ncbi:hypothetical protein [Planktotalea sp.]|uniref:hypothetical protein n=1 Tax=Planktotalea sp. TaxID=2029877 RepID=UPI003F6C1BA5
MRKLCLEGFTPLCKSLHLVLHLIRRNAGDDGVDELRMVAVNGGQFLLEGAAPLLSLGVQSVPLPCIFLTEDFKQFLIHKVVL